jgi:xanthine dehydrogenase accessory factor
VSSCDVFFHVSQLTSMGRPVVLVTEVRGQEVVRSVISDGVLIAGSKDHLRFYEEALRRGRLERVEGDRVIRAEALGSLPGVLVVGSGPISRMVARIAREVGFPVAHLSEEPYGSSDIVTASMDALNEALSGARFVVVANEPHSEASVDVVEAALRRGATYVGLMASERRAREAVEELMRRGLRPEDLRRLYAPIGLDLGGRSAGEIALSIVAEMLAVARSGSRSHMRDIEGPLSGAPSSEGEGRAGYGPGQRDPGVGIVDAIRRHHPVHGARHGIAAVDVGDRVIVRADPDQLPQLPAGGGEVPEQDRAGAAARFPPVPGVVAGHQQELCPQELGERLGPVLQPGRGHDYCPLARDPPGDPPGDLRIRRDRDERRPDRGDDLGRRIHRYQVVRPREVKPAGQVLEHAPAGPHAQVGDREHDPPGPPGDALHRGHQVAERALVWFPQRMDQQDLPALHVPDPAPQVGLCPEGFG